MEIQMAKKYLSKDKNNREQASSYPSISRGGIKKDVTMEEVKQDVGKFIADLLKKEWRKRQKKIKSYWN
jgi:hypothetical protein